MPQSVLRWIRLVLLGLAGLVLVALLMLLDEVVQLLVIGALMAYVLDPLVRRLEARGTTRTTASAIIFFALLILVGGFILALLPAVARQVAAIRATDVQHMVEAVQEVEEFLERQLASLGVAELGMVENVQDFVAERAPAVLGYVPGVLSTALNVLLVPVVAFFLLRDGRSLKKGFVSLVPNRFFEFTLNVLHKVDVQLGNYLRGLILGSAVVAVLSIFALWLLDVPYYVLIGVFAGFANLIPYVGPVAGGLIALLVSLFSTGTLAKAFAIIVAFAAIQVVDNAVVQPLVLAKNVKLHPLLILFALVIGGQFFGILGLFLAVPLTAVVKVMGQETLSNLRRYHLT